MNKALLSSTFVMRCRCKQCGSPPIRFVEAGEYRSALPLQQATQSQTSISWIMPSPHTIYNQYKSNLSEININIYEYTISISQTRKEKQYKTNETFICQCGTTRWILNYSNAVAKPEVLRRKATIHYSNSKLEKY